MSGELDLSLCANDIADIVAEIGGVYLGQEAAMIAERETAAEDPLTAFVTIQGAWPLAVSVSCSREMAADASRSMLGLEPHEVDEQTIFEVLGEMTNVIGGNMKALISEAAGITCQLSLPVVGDGWTAPFEASCINEVWFSWHERCLCVRLLRIVRDAGPPVTCHSTLQ